MRNLTKTIQNFAFQNDLWTKNSKIIIGVSGGSDSVCLLDVLSKLAPKYDLELHIAHVNYGLRGDDSKEDELFVRNLADKYQIPLTVLKPKKAEQKGNLENNLREIRYDFFETLRLDLGFDLVAIAHNQDDQAETVLMRILRGSGLNGLSAMKAKTKNIIRPLLQTSKKEILAYMKENKLKYRTDKSNFDVKFTRNNIRHKLLPYLEKNFNPAIKKTLSDWSSSVADDYDFINQQAQFFVDSVCKNKREEPFVVVSRSEVNSPAGEPTSLASLNNKCACFDAPEFLRQHDAIQRQVLRNILSRLKGNVIDLENGQIEEMIKVIKSSKSKSQKARISALNISKKGAKVDIRC